MTQEEINEQFIMTLQSDLKLYYTTILVKMDMMDSGILYIQLIWKTSKG